MYNCGEKRAWYTDENNDYFDCCDITTGQTTQQPKNDDGTPAVPLGPFNEKTDHVAFNSSKGEKCTKGGILPANLHIAPDGTIGNHVCGGTAMDMLTGGSKNEGFNCCPGESPSGTIYSYLPATYRSGKDRQNANCVGNPDKPDSYYLLFDGQCSGSCDQGGCNCTSCDNYGIPGYYCHDPGTLPHNSEKENCQYFKDRGELLEPLKPGETCPLKYTNTPWFHATLNYDSHKKYPSMVLPNIKCAWTPTGDSNSEAQDQGIDTTKKFSTLEACQNDLE